MNIGIYCILNIHCISLIRKKYQPKAVADSMGGELRGFSLPFERVIYYT